MRRRLFFAIGLIVVLGASVAAVAAARSGDQARQSAAGIAPTAAGQASGGCKMGYNTETSTLTPPDDSTTDNPPAASVTITKPCTGSVVGHFTAEVSTPNAGDFIHIDMRATCVGSGGQTPSCTVGKQLFASPGHTFFQNAQSVTGTRAMNMVWTGLGKGQWRFEVLPGGNNSANLQFRTFTVEAF